MSGNDEKQTIININLSDHYPQPQSVTPQFYPVVQPQMPRQAIAFPDLRKFSDRDIDAYWVLAAVFALFALYPSFDARVLLALRGDAAGGIVDSAPIPENPFENEFISPEPIPENPFDSEPVSPAPRPQVPPSAVPAPRNVVPPPAPAPRKAVPNKPGTIFTPSPKFDSLSKISKARRRIAELAIEDARKGLRYKVGQSARCADYVDFVLGRANWDTKNTITKQPLDKFRDTGKYMANRWAGPDIGQVITDPSKLEIGDIVFFRNTYGNWRRGAITHVGIYVGKGMIVDRGTAAAPVLYRSIRTFDKGGESKFSSAVRLHGKWFNGEK